MKKSNFLKSILFAFLAFATLSCDDDDETGVPQSNTIAAIAQRTPDLSLLVQALVRADLVSVLDGTTDYTVFAPTNAAFTTLLGTATLEDIPVADLREILLNHVVSGSVLGSQLPAAGYIKTLAKGGASTTNTLSMYVNTTSGIRLNGTSSVVTNRANIAASNGVIHIVDAVITLPTVVTFAVADPNFDLLQAALTREGDDITDFVAVLSGIGPFTVFAPTNDAFTSLLADDLGGIGLADIPEATLDAVLKYHVASGNVLSSELTSPGNTDVTSIQGSVFTITLPGTAPIIANITANGGRTSGIIAVDVQAANGVIHVINKVLLP